MIGVTLLDDETQDQVGVRDVTCLFRRASVSTRNRCVFYFLNSSYLGRFAFTFTFSLSFHQSIFKKMTVLTMLMVATTIQHVASASI